MQRSPFARHDSSFSMPSVELLQSFNKGSVKVNKGLRFGGCGNFARQSEATDALFASGKPAVYIDFGQLIAPIVAPESKPGTDVLVQRLLHPPAHAFVHGIVSIQWAMGAVGKQHFRLRASDERYVLTPESDLRKRGIELGIPVMYIEWLNGDDEMLSATEQGMHLTRAFFCGLDLKLQAHLPCS